MGSYWINDLNPIFHNPRAEIQAQSVRPKIIQIPVQFVGSDDAAAKQSPATAAASALPTEEARNAAAVTIQRAVRGFLVRKNAFVVRQVAGEVKEIERKLREDEANVRVDARERLLVSEKLMALLLRLDSVRGVRDIRKKVIRRIISLQEAIDSISVADDAPMSTADMTEEPEESREEAYDESSKDHEKKAGVTLDSGEEMNEEATELVVDIPAAVESPKRNIELLAWSGEEECQEASRIELAEEKSIDHKNATDQRLGLPEENNKVATVLETEIPAVVESSEIQIDLIRASNDTIPSRSVAEIAEKAPIHHERKADQTLDLELEATEDEPDLEADVPSSVESQKRKSDKLCIEIGKDGVMSPETEELEQDEGGVSFSPEVETESKEGRGMREMVQKMAVENERLKEMVAQLCATSSEQNRLMEALVDRVKHLERVVHHRMDRRKKRRSVAPCSLLSSDK